MLNFSGELCGYVYFSESKSFIYCCVFCEMRLESAQELENHNMKEHLFLDGETPTDHKKFKSSSTVIHSNEDDNNVLLKNSTTTFSDNTLNGIKLEEEYIVSEANDNILDESKGEVQDEALNEEKTLGEIVLISPNKKNESNICRSTGSDNTLNSIKLEEEYIVSEANDNILVESEGEFNDEGLNEEKILSDIDDANLCCKYCQRQFNKLKSWKKHIKDHLNYILTCKICGKHAKKRLTAEIHFKTHSKLKCDYCDSNFSSQRKLETHTRKHETLKCKYCNKMCKSLSGIRLHLRTHTGEKPFKCDVCSVAFADKRNLTTHFVTQHTGDVKNFACKFCERRFKTKQLHNWHIKRVHLKEKPHQCELCGLNFVNMSDMKHHNLRNHTDYDKRPHHCEICNKKFVELKKLTEHMNTHTGEKPFECDVCFKCFGRQKTLREHKKLHTGKKSHVCKICGKAFAQNSGRANHMKQHNIVKQNFELIFN